LTAGLLVAVVFGAGGAEAVEYEASTAPDGSYLLKVYPKFFYTSAHFSAGGRALNMTDVTGLLYFELPVHLQYGITKSFSIGTILPLGWTYQEEEERQDPVSRLTVREFWITLKYRWLTVPVISSSSVRIKVPLADKKSWEDGLRIGDGQVDVYPLLHLDYFNNTLYWYVMMTAGYKYRFKTGETKPFDELTFHGRAGYELFPDLRMRFYLYTNLTEFMNGDFSDEELEFFEKEGNLHEFGYGVSLWPRPTFRVDLTTGGDWSGTNQYRGMRWGLGFTKIF
jgi:hypothetical protein